MSANLPVEQLSPGPIIADGASILRREEIDPGTAYVAPSGAVETRVAAIFQDLLHLDMVGSADSFFELGGDSLRAVELFLTIEREFGISLSPSTIIYRPTVAKLAALLAENAPIDTDRGLVTLQSDGAEPPLFFVHAIDVAVFGYRLLAQHLGSERKIYALVSPGQDAALSMQEMAQIYVGVISRVQPKGPCFLVGYCLGGTLTYEIARQLEQQGRRVALLVLIDAGIRDVSVSGGRRLARKLSYHVAELTRQSPRQWFGYLWAKARKELDRHVKLPDPEPGSAPEPEQSRAQQVLLAAHSVYVPLPYGGDMKLIRCAEGRYGSEHLGWRAYVKGDIEVCNLPMHHSAALAEPTVGLVAAQLKRWLVEVP